MTATLNEDLFFKIKYYLADLLNAKNNEIIQQRLNDCNEYYLPYFYFNTDEIEQILSHKINGLEIRQIITSTINNKLLNKQKTHICTSHDIFPIYQNIFQLEKNFHKEKSFTKKHKLFLKNIIYQY
jgi:hypothetical protein